MVRSDFFKGLLRWQSETSLNVKNIATLVSVFFFLVLLLIGLSLSLFVPQNGVKNEASYQVAGLMARLHFPVGRHRLNYINQTGEKEKYPYEHLREVPYVIENHGDFMTIFYPSIAASILLSFLLIFSITRLLSSKKTASKNIHNSFIRGGELVPDKELIRRIMAMNEASDIYLGTVPFVSSLLARHLGVFGDTGTGKSQLIFSILRTLRALKKKLLIVDKSGEFVQHFYNPKTDILLGPFDERTHGWTPYNEGTELFDCERLAKSFIPSLQGMPSSQDHWPEAAVTVLSWLLYRMNQDGQQLTIDDLINLLVVSRNEVHTDELGNEKIVKVRAINELLRGSLAELVIDPDSPDHAASVLATIIPKIRALWYLRGLEDRPVFSFRKWVQDPEAGSVFIRVTEDQLDSVNPVITAWIDTVIKTALSMEKSNDRELWAFVDELQSFEKINTLRKGVYEGRKYGLRFVLGFTSVQELFSVYGEHTAKSIISMLCTKAVFRTSEPDGAEWNSRLLGDEEVMAEQQHTNYGQSGSLSVGDQRQRHSLVSGTEITALPDLNFYLKFAGPWPLSKVEQTYRKWPDVSAPFMPRALSEERHDNHPVASENSPSSLMACETEDHLL